MWAILSGLHCQRRLTRRDTDCFVIPPDARPIDSSVIPSAFAANVSSRRISAAASAKPASAASIAASQIRSSSVGTVSATCWLSRSYRRSRRAARSSGMADLPWPGGHGTKTGLLGRLLGDPHAAAAHADQNTFVAQVLDRAPDRGTRSG